MGKENWKSTSIMLDSDLKNRIPRDQTISDAVNSALERYLSAAPAAPQSPPGPAVVPKTEQAVYPHGEEILAALSAALPKSPGLAGYLATVTGLPVDWLEGLGKQQKKKGVK
jgi:hypothetical protein